MRPFLLTVLAGIVGINFCMAQSNKLGEQKKIKLEKVRNVDLQENKYNFTKASDLAVADQFFFISCREPATVIKYNFEGQQIQKIGDTGRGPFEYNTPSNIELNNDSLFVWDANLLKLIIYSDEGGSIDEIAAFSEGIADFKVAGDRIALFLSGKKSEYFIKVFNVKNNSPVVDYGNRNDVHDLFMMYDNSGGIAFLNADHLLYGSPAADILHRANLTEDSDSAVDLNEDQFTVQTKNIPKYRPANIDKVAEYLFSNSRLSGIHGLKDYIVVELQVGEVEDESRTNILHVFDTSLNKIDTIELKFEFLEKYGEVISTTNGNTLYYLNNYSSEIEAEKVGIILTGWKISEEVKK